MTNASRRNGASSQATTPDPIVHSHVSYGRQGQVLLMTCQICVLGPDGRTLVARALLDTASWSSFITERLVQHLQLPRQHQHIEITGIGRVMYDMMSRSIVSFGIASVLLRKGNKTMQLPLDIEAVVLPKLTAQFPACSMNLDPK